MRFICALWKTTSLSVFFRSSFTKSFCDTTYVSSKISTTGGILTKIFNLQSNKFITVSCLKCGYTELYKTVTSGIENVTDFLIGN